MFKVGRDCPYYTSGHQQMTFTLDKNGSSVVSMSGPWNETYDKEE